MNYTLHTAYSMLVSLFTLPSFGGDGYRCEIVDPSAWITRVEIVEQLAGDGWEIYRAKRDHGCWKILGSTPDGQRAKIYLHPISGEVERVMQFGAVTYEKDRLTP